MSGAVRIGVALIGAEVAMAGFFALAGVTGHMTGTAYASGPLEDEPGYSCIVDGNHVCGPDNSNGYQPGCYNDAGALVAPWPCRVIVNPDGTSDVYR